MLQPYTFKSFKDDLVKQKKITIQRQAHDGFFSFLFLINCSYFVPTKINKIDDNSNLNSLKI